MVGRATTRARFHPMNPKKIGPGAAKKKSSASAAPSSAKKRNVAKAPAPSTARKASGRANPSPARTPAGAVALSDLRRIARAIVTSTSVGNEKRMRSLYAGDVVSEEVATGEKVRGLDRLEEKVSLPADLRRRADWSVRNLWCDGQTIVVEWEARLPAERPGSPRIPLREIAIHEVRNGKIVRERFYYDASSQP